MKLRRRSPTKPKNDQFNLKEELHLFKLPVCPYCHAIYRYSEIGNIKGKECECYHCQKSFEVNRRLRAVPVVIVCILLIIINLFMMHTSIDLNLRPMIAIDAVSVFLSLLAFPFTVRFLPIKPTKTMIHPKKRKPKNKPKKTSK